MKKILIQLDESDINDIQTCLLYCKTLHPDQEAKAIVEELFYVLEGWKTLQLDIRHPDDSKIDPESYVNY